MHVNPKPVGQAPMAVIGAAIGMIVALICVAAFSMTGLSVNAGVVGAVAGAVAGAATARLGGTDRIE